MSKCDAFSLIEIKTKFVIPTVLSTLKRAQRSIPNTKLDELNDDCLARIFELVDLNDLYHICLASPRFSTVLPLFHRKYAFSVKNVAAPNLKHFLETVGMKISQLTVAVSEYNRSPAEIVEFFEYVQKHCPNIKRMEVKKWPHLNFSKFTQLLQRLTSLQLDECDNVEDSDVFNRRFVIRPWTVQLNALELAVPKSCALTELTSLTTLKLHRCKGFGPNHFLEFLQKNNRLTELSLFALKDFNKSNLDESFFDGLARHLQSVQTISVDVNTTSHIQFIANLPNLRSLQLLDYSTFNDRIVDRLLRRLSEANAIRELDLYHCHLGPNSYRVITQFQQLHTLKLRKNFWVTDQHLNHHALNHMQSLKTLCCFDNIVLTDDGLLAMVGMAPQLTQLDCSWCFQITNRAIYDILHLLQTQPHRPNLEILVGGRTKISEAVLKVSEINHTYIYNIVYLVHTLIVTFSLGFFLYRICHEKISNELPSNSTQICQLLALFRIASV